AAAFTGGNSGPAFVPGKSPASRLIRYVSGLDKEIVMPPSGPRLAKEQITMLARWIDAGAKWPDDGSVTARPGSNHWAFQPISHPAVPAVKNADWCRTPIDYFILSRLEKEIIQPSPEADRVTLIRRLYLDLVGLPPTIADVDAFLADSSP